MLMMSQKLKQLSTTANILGCVIERLVNFNLMITVFKRYYSVIQAKKLLITKLQFKFVSVRLETRAMGYKVNPGFVLIGFRTTRPRLTFLEVENAFHLKTHFSGWKYLVLHAKVSLVSLEGVSA